MARLARGCKNKTKPRMNQERSEATFIPRFFVFFVAFAVDN